MDTEALKPTGGVQKHVNNLLRLFNSNDRLERHPSFHFVTSWCELHEEECGLYCGGTGDSFTAVNLAGEQEAFTDDDLRDYLSLPDHEQVTDDMRESYIRSRLEKILKADSMDADVHPTVCMIRMRSSKGREAYLGYELRGYSFSGVTLKWLGLFEGIDDLRASFRARGFLTCLEDCRAIDRSSLLDLWQM